MAVDEKYLLLDDLTDSIIIDNIQVGYYIPSLISDDTYFVLAFNYDKEYMKISLLYNHFEELYPVLEKAWIEFKNRVINKNDAYKIL